MKKLFLIGGMGAGKSTARKALTDEGLAWIDLDQVGHEVLMWDTVKDDLRGAFGDDIFDENGEVVRSALAAKAFATPAATRKLNTITMPRIEERYTDLIDGFEAEGKPAVVVEYSVFRNRQQSLAYGADVVMAVLAPLETRIERAVASGFSEEDVRARIARQITDADASRQPTWSSTTTAPPKSSATRSWPGGTSIRRSCKSHLLDLESINGVPRNQSSGPFSVWKKATSASWAVIFGTNEFLKAALS